MATKVKVAATADLPPGRACVVEAAGKAIALVNAAGQLYAVDNACMHRGGPVGDGALDGLVLTCPWHGWRWDPAVKLACYPVTVEHGAVWVEV
jgi:nitrite reductase/ring-hydroxylating ferredoxin subunit